MTADVATPWSDRHAQRHKTLLERLVEKYAVNPDTGCWEWQAARVTGGYGVLMNRRAHVISYEIFVGPVPEGLVLDHLCVVAHCVNPAHLEAVTPEENRRRQRMRQTHCRNGHPLGGENLLLVRRCRTCARAAEERYVAKCRKENS